MSAETISIPKQADWDAPGPGWLTLRDTDGRMLKPLIKCKCGAITGIGLHHVHANGRVTGSFYHKAPEDPSGCGWHVFLVLQDYFLGDFPPEPISARK